MSEHISMSVAISVVALALFGSAAFGCKQITQANLRLRSECIAAGKQLIPSGSGFACVGAIER